MVGAAREGQDGCGEGEGRTQRVGPNQAALFLHQTNALNSHVATAIAPASRARRVAGVVGVEGGGQRIVFSQKGTQDRTAKSVCVEREK